MCPLEPSEEDHEHEDEADSRAPPLAARAIHAPAARYSQTAVQASQVRGRRAPSSASCARDPALSLR